MILAKPTGIELDVHVHNVHKEMGYILSMYPFMKDKYEKRTGKIMARNDAS